MGSFAHLRALAVGIAIAVASAVHPATAANVELSDAEIAQLYAGHPVVREDNVERDGHRYIGGVSYVLVDATPEQVTAALDDVGTYRHILPRTRSVRWIGLSRKGDAVIELEQGNALAHGKYTVRVQRDRASPDTSSATVRFWLDHQFSHDIADANGFFRVEAHGEKTLLTYLVMVDLGSGLFGRLFEGRVRKIALSTPMLVKSYVESHLPRYLSED
jgi:carbon monoxide dehydrogenase subunit G